MELILLSVFGTASVFVLEFFGLFYERWLREPNLIGSERDAAPSANLPGAPMAGRFLSCTEAANDAYATTIVRVRERRAHFESAGE